MSLKLDYNAATTQNIVVTLSESMDTSLKYHTGLTYAFTFTNEQNNSGYTISLIDKSTVPFRYNLFELTTLSGVTGATNVCLPLSGWYMYSVKYNNIELEIGKCYVDDGVTVSSTYNNTNLKYVYKK